MVVQALIIISFKRVLVQKLHIFGGPKSTVSIEFAKAFEVEKDDREQLSPWPVLRLKVGSCPDPLLFVGPVLSLAQLLSASQGRLTATDSDSRAPSGLHGALEFGFPWRPFSSGDPASAAWAITSQLSGWSWLPATAPPAFVNPAPWEAGVAYGC